MCEGQDGRAYAEFVRNRRHELLERIERAASRAGRSADEVTLLAVSKTVGIDEVRVAFDCGYRVFGENRPQELKRKVSAARADPRLADARFDMIGNLQKNKINQVLGNAVCIHSVSSKALAEAIAMRARCRGLSVRCLLEVNVSGEQSKSGFSPDEVRDDVRAIMEMEGITVEGLMSMAPANDSDAARRCFSGLRELRDELADRTGRPLPTLSCGMSGDFEIAVEEGSTLLRLGRIVFDPAFGNE